MFKRILVPLDGSEVVESILPYVEDLETAVPLIPHALCIVYGDSPHLKTGTNPIPHSSYPLPNLDDTIG